MIVKLKIFLENFKSVLDKKIEKLNKFPGIFTIEIYSKNKVIHNIATDIKKKKKKHNYVRKHKKKLNNF